MVKSAKKKANFIIIIIVVILVVLSGLIWWNFGAGRLTELPPAPSAGNKDAPLATSVAKKLEIPWALDFLPDGSIVFTERPGRVRLIDAQEGLLPEPLLTIDEVAHRGEGGLLGVAVHPDFANNHFIYVYYTYQGDENLANTRFVEKVNILLGQAPECALMACLANALTTAGLFIT